MNEDDSYKVGWGKPPLASRFQPGQSGNKRGAPKKNLSNLPYETVLGQTVTVFENGRRKRMRADTAFLLLIIGLGAKGNVRIAKQASRALRIVKANQSQSPRFKTFVFQVYAEPGQVDHCMRNIGMARLLDPCGPSAQMALEPWLVEEALERLGDRRLTPDEQEIVVAATHLPHKVGWPDWWQIR